MTALAGRGEGGLGTLLHLLRRHLFHMGRNAPHVAERIGDRPEAIAPELVGNLHGHGCARVHGSLHDGVDALSEQEDARARAAELLRRAGGGLRERIRRMMIDWPISGSACPILLSGIGLRTRSLAPNAFL
jgi:hypothetical protein